MSDSARRRSGLRLVDTVLRDTAPSLYCGARVRVISAELAMGSEESSVTVKPLLRAPVQKAAFSET